MPLDPAADNTATVIGIENLKSIAGHSAYTNSQRQTAALGHASRSDQYAELAHQNAIANQQLATQAALDHQVEVRAINKMVLGVMANKLLNMDSEEAVSSSQLFKGNANSDILSLLNQVAAGQISGKIAMTTPPTSAADTGFASLLAMNNTLNQQNYSNNAVNSSLAAIMTALSAISLREPVVRDTTPVLK